MTRIKKNKKRSNCIHKKMNRLHKNKIQYLIEYMRFCPKDFKCVKSDFKDMCNAKDVGLDHFLMCLAEKPFECPSSIKHNNEYYCDCPLRIFIGKNIERYLNTPCECQNSCKN